MEACLRVHGRLSLRRVLAVVGVELLASRLGVARGDAKPDASRASDESAADADGGEDQRQVLSLALCRGAADLHEFRHAARHVILGAPPVVVGLLLRWGERGAMSATPGRAP